jgi:hypothetical protein
MFIGASLLTVPNIYLPPVESASVFLPLRAVKFFLTGHLFGQAGFRGDAFSA